MTERPHRESFRQRIRNLKGTDLSLYQSDTFGKKWKS